MFIVLVLQNDDIQLDGFDSSKVSTEQSGEKEGNYFDIRLLQWATQMWILHTHHNKPWASWVTILIYSLTLLTLLEPNSIFQHVHDFLYIFTQYQLLMNVQSKVNIIHFKFLSKLLTFEKPRPRFLIRNCLYYSCKLSVCLVLQWKKLILSELILA